MLNQTVKTLAGFVVSAGLFSGAALLEVMELRQKFFIGGLPVGKPQH